MKTKAYNYRIVVEKETQGTKTVYVSYVPSLGLSDFGVTVDEAVASIEQAIKLYLETLVELHEPVPAPDADDFYITTKKIKLNLPAGV